MPLPYRGSIMPNVHSTSKIVPAFVALAASAALGFGVLAPIQSARAEVAAGQTVQTPFGHAPLTFADLVDKVKPAVVSVSVVNDGGASKLAENDKDGKKGGGLTIPDLPPDHPLHDFFKHLPKEFGQEEGRRPKVVQGQGSGFVISADGYVVTNNHVIDGATKIQVAFDDDETKYEAKLIGTDQRTDVALLKIDSNKTFPFVKLSEKKPRVGDWALAVGNPFGLGGTVTAGIVSARGRDVAGSNYGDFLQIDAAVNMGNSGGPTFNLKGEVIGVNTEIFSPNGGNVGIAFDIPAKTVQAITSSLIKTGTVTRGFLDVKIQDVTPDIADSVGLKSAKGALITDVTEGGPGAKAGLKSGDIVTKVDNVDIDNALALSRTIAGDQPGQAVQLTVWRDGKETTLSVTLGTFSDKSTDNAKPTPPPQDDQGATQTGVGLTVVPNGNGEGILVQDVDQDSVAAEKGFQVGDTILEVDNKKVATGKQFEDAIAAVKSSGRGTALIKAERDGNVRFIGLPLDSSKG